MIELIEANTIKILTEFKQLKEELKNCNKIRKIEILTYLDCLMLSLGEIPSDIQKVLVLKYFENKSNKEIARAFKIGITKVDKKVNRAVGKLSSILYFRYNIHKWTI